MKLVLNDKTVFVEIYQTFWKRFLGLMGQKNIKKIIVFPKCNSIHTFFMKEEIDVIMTDRQGTILYYYKGLKPWRLILPKRKVYYTFEGPKNSFAKVKKKLLFK